MISRRLRLCRELRALVCYIAIALTAGQWRMVAQPSDAPHLLFAQLNTKAISGDLEAQFSLGWCYCNGYGVPKDRAEAAIWFRKAAEQGNAKAQFYLGICYSSGDGVSKDSVKAVEWFRRAFEQGLAPAQKVLGGFYYHGEG